MDPATAFQLACGAIQLVDFGLKTAKAFREILKSKTALTSENESLDHQTQLLSTTSTSVGSHLKKIPKAQLRVEQAHLLRIAEECTQHSQALLKELDELKLAGPRRKRDAPFQWARLMLRKGKIDEIRVQLMRCQELLDTQMLSSLCHDVDLNNGEQLELLRQINLSQLQSTETFQETHNSFKTLVSDIEKNLAKTIVADGKETRMLVEDLNIKDRNRQDFEHLLQSLGFPTMRSRQEDIHEAYPKTFQWLFERKTHSRKPGDNFIDWLEKGTGIYWVSGKPGSGKSTLMNFLIEQSSFKTAAEVWAADDRLIVATYFFWRAGMQDQKSINGLLRSLLYHLLSEYPQFASFVDQSTLRERQEWSNKRLQATIKRIVERCQSEKVKVCLVIDGLDEFEGHEFERDLLVDIVEDLLEGAFVKAIVSSRQEPPFIERFSSYESLRLQDLTESDIHEYVRGMLLQKDLIKIYQKSHPGEVSSLLYEVVRKADGVFLWARLAVQDLITGIWRKNSIQDLQDRLDHLDNSLDGIFSQLLARIHPVDQANAANYLKFQESFNSLLPDLDLTVMDVAFGCDPELASNLRRLFIEKCDDVALHEAVNLCSKGLDDLVTRLSTQCAGLLDVNTSRSTCATRYPYNFSVLYDPVLAVKLSPTGQLVYHFQYFTSINIVHRSVWDFLRENSQALSFLEKASMSSENIDLGVLWAAEGAATCVLSLSGHLEDAEAAEILRRDMPTNANIQHILVNSFESSFRPIFKLENRLGHEPESNKYHQRLEARCHWVATRLKRLERSMKQHNRDSKRPIDREGEPIQMVLALIGSVPISHLSLCLMIGYGADFAAPYVLEVLDGDHEPFLHYLFQATIYALEHPGVIIFPCQSILQLIQRYLELGLDPTIKYSGSTTLWKRYLKYLQSFYKELRYWDKFVDDPKRIWKQHMGLVEMFVEHGADIQTAIETAIQRFRSFISLDDYRLEATKSVLQVLTEISSWSRHSNDALISKLEASGALRVVAFTGIRKYKESLKLRSFTEEQQQKLAGAVIRWEELKNSYDFQVNRERYKETEIEEAENRLRDVVDEVWEANSQLIERY